MKTKIEWCDEVWNPVWGCYHRCPYCYAKKIARRFGKTELEKTFEPVWKESNFNRKFAKNTKRVFVNSMSDPIFWDPKWMSRVIDRIAQHPEIDFIFLTKDVNAYERYSFPPNVILGYTFTNPNAIMGVIRQERTLLNIEPITRRMEQVDRGYLHTLVGCYDWVIVGALTNYKTSIVPYWSWYQPIVSMALDMRIPVFIKPSLEVETPPPFYVQQYPGRNK